MTSSVSSDSLGNCHAEPVDVSSEAFAKEEASRRRRSSHLGNTPSRLCHNHAGNVQIVLSANSRPGKVNRPVWPLQATRSAKLHFRMESIVSLPPLHPSDPSRYIIPGLYCRLNGLLRHGLLTVLLADHIQPASQLPASRLPSPPV